MNRRFDQLCAGAMRTILSAATLAQPICPAPEWFGLDKVRVHLERLTEHDLKALYLRCASASTARVLDRDDAAYCTLAADTLQRNHFRGDFDAMLTWWRAHRDGPLGPQDARRSGGPGSQ